MHIKNAHPLSLRERVRERGKTVLAAIPLSPLGRG
jgi:hypothetical protein